MAGDHARRRRRRHRCARDRRSSASGSIAKRGTAARRARRVTLEDFMAQTAAGERRTLRIVIKADQGGPAEALADALAQLSTSEVEVEVIHRGVGAVTESDILLAKASGAIIVGFHVRPDNNARAAAEREGVEIKLYRIIYEAVADVRAALEGLLRPEQREVVDRRGAWCASCSRWRRSARSRAASSAAASSIARAACASFATATQMYDGEHRLAAPLQGRCARSAPGVRVRYRHRELQRRQGQRHHRVLPDGAGRPHVRFGAGLRRGLICRMTPAGRIASRRPSARRSRCSSPRM